MPAPREKEKENKIRKRKTCYFTENKIEHVDYKDDRLLRKFINERGKIVSREQLFEQLADATQSTLTPTSATLTANGSDTQVLTVQSKDLYGINLLGGESHTDVTLVLGHNVENTTSTEVMRNVVFGKAKGVFQGQIRVAPGARMNIRPDR